METICWEIRVDAGGFVKGGNYGTMLWYHTMDSRQWSQELVEHPGSADLSRMMRVERVKL